MEQQLAQRHPASLATGEVVDEHLGGRASQRVHGLVEPAVEVPGVRVVQLGLEVARLLVQLVQVRVRVAHGGVQLVEPGHLALELADGLLDVLQHGLALGERRLLLEHPHRRLGVEDRVTVVGVVQARHDLEQRRLAGTVGADHADLRPVQEGQGHVVEDDLVAVGLAHVAQGEHIFRHGPRA